MAPALGTATAPTAEIYFELDRFDVSEDEPRIELSGRWFGVRGRRFVRPTLTLNFAGEPQRLLATIDHKPWAADDGEAWVAAFPWSFGAEAVTDLELGVAPDIAVELPLPGSAPQRTEAPRARPSHRTRRDPQSEAARLLEVERDENERLRSELAHAEAASVHTEAAIARRDAAFSKVEELAAELDEAVRVRDVVLAAQDEAMADRDAALASRDEALADRDAALRDRDAALHSYEVVVQDRDAAVQRSEQLTRTVTALEGQLRDASGAAQRAESERRQTLLELERAQVGAAARSALRASPPVARRHFVWRRPGGSDSSWATRLLALAVLIGVLLALTLITHVV